MDIAGRIIYVHGFGGRNENPSFHIKLQGFLQSKRVSLGLETFAWDSLPSTPDIVVHNFLRSQEESYKAGEILASTIASLESQQCNYHIVGFSLGANVVRHALSALRQPLSYLKSVYFLGAAFPHNTTINEGILPATGRYHNYFSGNDMTLKISYFNVSNTYAAGTTGIEKTTLFRNLQTQCTHTLMYNYDVLADAIGYLVAWDEDQIIPGTRNFNIIAPTVGGKLHWNNICYYKNCIVQQNIHSGHYRALQDTPLMKRRAWGDNLHVVLQALQ